MMREPGGSSRDVEEPPGFHRSDFADRFKAAADNAPVMIWMCGTDRHFDWFNRPWLLFTGRTMSEEVGTGWLAGIHPDDRERCLGIHTVSFDARVPFEMDYRMRRHDGVYRWVLDQGVPHYAAEGQFIGYVGSCIDIDERRALEDRLAMRTEALRIAERRRDTLLAALVDELRVSLASMSDATQTIAQTREASGSLGAVQRLVQTVLSRLEPLLGGEGRNPRSPPPSRPADRAPVSAGALLNVALDALPARLRQGGRLGAVETREPALQLQADPRLGRVIGKTLECALELAGTASILGVQLTANHDAGALALTIRDERRSIGAGLVTKVLAYFAEQDAEAVLAGAAAPHCRGVMAFTAPDDAAVTFVISSPWLEPAPG